MSKLLFSKGLLLILALSFSSLAIAQPTPTNSLADSVSMMYLNYFKLMETNKVLGDSLGNMNQSLLNINSNWSDVDKKLSRITDDLSTSLTQVNRITKNDLLTKEARLNTKKNKILATSTFIRSANNSFDAIDAALAQSDYLSDVGSLSSPTNTDLGFSLSDEVVKVLQDKIIKSRSKVGATRARKVIKFVQEVVKHPVVTSFTNSVPALSSINSVIGLVSNLAINDKKVSVDEYMEFNKAMQKYIAHYEALGSANSEFSSKINKLRTQTEGLRAIVRNFTEERIKTTVPDAKFDKKMALHEIISQYYDRRDLEKRLNNIKNEHQKSGRLNLQSALNDKRLDFPFYAVNQAQFIQQELESITNEYIATYQYYHKDITKVLNNSKMLSKEPAKIDTKINLLEKKLVLSVEAFKRNVKIREVSKNLQRIPNL
ncbi:MAG: hypothetical protein ACPG19_06520 [Saprospiraceae bacterium]